MSTTTKSKLRLEVGDEVIVTSVKGTFLGRNEVGKRGTIRRLNPVEHRNYAVSVDSGAPLYLNDRHVRLVKRRAPKVGDRVTIARVPKYAPTRVLGEPGRVETASWTSRWDFVVNLDNGERVHAKANELRRVKETGYAKGDHVRLTSKPLHAPETVRGQSGTIAGFTRVGSSYDLLIRLDGGGSVLAAESDVQASGRTAGDTSTGAQSTPSISVGTSPLSDALGDNEAKVNRVAVALLKSSAPKDTRSLLTLARTAVHAAGPTGSSVTDRVNAVALSVLKAGDAEAAEDVLKLARAAVAAA